MGEYCDAILDEIVAAWRAATASSCGFGAFWVNIRPAQGAIPHRRACAIDQKNVHFSRRVRKCARLNRDSGSPEAGVRRSELTTGRRVADPCLLISVASSPRGWSAKCFTALVVIPLGLIFIRLRGRQPSSDNGVVRPFNSVIRRSRCRCRCSLIIAVAILGVAAGGSATWFRQRRWRRTARQHEADARRARAEIADLRAAAAVSRGGPPQLAAPAQRGIYGATGRDKQGATL
jgi:hypothetical protein